MKGLSWGGGAIGTAEWEGVLLRDVLTWAGLDPALAQHIQVQKKTLHTESNSSDTSFYFLHTLFAITIVNTRYNSLFNSLLF